MKTKKLLTLLGATALFVTVLAACGDDPADEEVPTNHIPAKNVPEDTPPPPEVNEPAPSADEDMEQDSELAPNSETDPADSPDLEPETDLESE